MAIQKMFIRSRAFRVDYGELKVLALRWKNENGCGRESTDRISGETNSSGSLSSPSERFSDEQDCSKESPNNITQSPEVTSKAVVEDEFSDSIKKLTEKLSAALVNVSAKEDLVKQHVKVAEEAVAGWEKSENEVAALKQQLEAAVQQNVSLEVRESHLDGALKECVRQLRQAKEEQDQRICDALVDKTSKWESIKSELEDKILELQVHKDAAMSNYPSSFEPSISPKLDSLEKENSMLKAELLSLSEELEIKTTKMDLSTQAAETSSKQHLESIRKLAKVEAECRRLQALARKSSNFNDQKSASSSMYVDSLTDSQSDSGDVLSSVDVDVCKKSKFIQHGIENNCSDSWASALIVELDQFKNEKAMTRNLTACSLEIDIMDDFLEMERLAAVPEPKSKVSHIESGDTVDTPSSLEKEIKAELDSTRKRLAESEYKLEKMEAEKAEMEKMACHMSDLRQEPGKIQTENKELHNLTCDMSDLREKLKKTEAEKTELQNMSSHMDELEDKLEKMEAENAELEAKLVKMEAEKAMLEKALDRSQDSLRDFESKLRETETLLQEFQMELASVNETKEAVEFQLISMEAEARTTAANIDSLKAQIEKEKGSAEQLAAKCLELENELNLKSQVVEFHPIENYHLDPKPKQEDLDVAADKLAECQKTIASLGRQLESLATLEDFLIDTANLPGFSTGASLVPKARSESWKLHLNDIFATRSDSEVVISSHTVNGNDGELPSSSSPWASSSDNNTPKNRNGFGKLFSRSKNGIQVENHQR